jgi:hypothetical protein
MQREGTDKTEEVAWDGGLNDTREPKNSAHPARYPIREAWISIVLKKD